jgi:hypothetical protein
MGKKKTSKKIRKKITTKLKDKKTLNNVSSFFILVFLLVISLITFPTNSLNSYNFEGDYNTVKGNKDKGLTSFFNLDKKPSTIKTENRDISELRRDVDDSSDDEGNRDNEEVFLGSFGYSNSNFDNDISNLRIDSVSTGISFYPDVRVDELSESELVESSREKFNNFSCNDFKEDQSDIKCILDNCLELKNNNLFYNNEKVNLPEELENIEAITLSTLDNTFITSFTLKEGGSYISNVYSYNGISFSKLSNMPEIRSDKFGLVGLGGTLDDFILVYGATKGSAYHIRNGEIEDISSFFDYRVMKQGLKTEIIRVDDTRRVDWYVYSSTCKKPLFLKLWEDNDREIIGEISLLNQIPFIGEQLILNLNEYNNNYRKFSISYNGIRGDKYFNFYDYGFKNNNTGYLYSKSLNFSSSKKVNLKQVLIAGAKTCNGDDYAFEISIDDSSFSEINSVYNRDNISTYILRLKLDKEDDKFYSPFLKDLSFDYAYSKL